jgi:hypothetical protein
VVLWCAKRCWGPLLPDISVALEPSTRFNTSNHKAQYRRREKHPHARLCYSFLPCSFSAAVMSCALARASSLKLEIRLAQAVSEFGADLSHEQKTAFWTLKPQSLSDTPTVVHAMSCSCRPRLIVLYQRSSVANVLLTSHRKFSSLPLLVF